MLKQMLAIGFIFLGTSLGWVILGATIVSRTYGSNEQLQSKVASTWGTSQQQSPPTASYWSTNLTNSAAVEDGKVEVRTQSGRRQVSLPIESSKVTVNIRLSPRRKGLLWYSTYEVDFEGNYKFRNASSDPQVVEFRLKFPAQRAIYDGLRMRVNEQFLPSSTDDQGTASQVILQPGELADLVVGYRSQGLDSWRYQLGDGVAQVRNFVLTMQTNFKDIDFADDTLSPTAKQPVAGGWKLDWQYSNLISGFQIGMTMPAKIQPGPLAGEISYAAPVSLFFFFFLMFIVTTLRNIRLHPMNYFFLATAFFAFHLLLAYLVDHIEIHAAMAVASIVSVALVISYLRLVIGLRFAAVEAAIAQLIYLVLFSYAFFWKGFTGLAITIIAILTLFVVMQTAGRIRWSERFSARPLSSGSQPTL